MGNAATAAGSYAFEHFDRTDAELARLRLQATAALPLEQSVWRSAGLIRGDRVLDLACGPGFISAELARHVGPEGSVMGVDLSASLLRTAEQVRARERMDHLRFSRGDVYALDLPEQSFDFVYARLLFQHLREPGRALAQLRPLVAPGGTICILDVDDAWLTVHPSPEAFTRFTERAREGQRLNGGDRHIGRRLGALLQVAGFEEVRTQIVPMTSHDVGMRTFLDITTGFKLEQVPLAHRDEAEADLRAIYSLADDPLAFGAVGVFCAVGRAGSQATA